MRPASGARWVSAAKTVRWTVFESGVAPSASGASRTAQNRDTRRRPARSDNPEVVGSLSLPPFCEPISVRFTSFNLTVNFSVCRFYFYSPKKITALLRAVKYMYFSGDYSLKSPPAQTGCKPPAPLHKNALILFTCVLS